jgi:uncharacterized phage protein gp47/JayE
MLTQVSEKYPNLDTREGSVLFNALAPAAVETAVSYLDLAYVLNQSFILTADRRYLLMACYQMGMDVTDFDASAGVFKAEFNAEVPIGSRWNCDIYNFTAINAIGLNSETGYYEYQMSCDTTGTVANSVTGDLSPIDYMGTDLTHARLTACLVEGENEATDDDIRLAYVEFVTSSVSDGNVAQYKRWCSSYDGIGKSKIFPLWNGDNTVKVSILTTSNLPVDLSEDANLVEKFQEYLDPIQETFIGDGITKSYILARKPYLINSVLIDGVALANTKYSYNPLTYTLSLTTAPENGIPIRITYPGGMGNGAAPIGAFVTVSTATAVPVKVTANVKLASGYSASAMPDIESKLREFFSTVAYEKNVVSYMSVGAAVLDVPGVEFVSNLMLNGASADVILNDEEVPILGETKWTVVS